MDLSGVRIVIPHRGLRDGKARLAAVLAPDERAALNGFMLDKVARAARAAVPDVVLISPDATLAVRAAELGLSFSRQSGGTGMNHALEQATTDAIADGVRTLAVISADLALVSSTDVKALLLVAHTCGGPSVTIAPDRAGIGTNALVVQPPGAIPFRFGLGSRSSHARECANLGVGLTFVERPGLMHDVDLPSDLAAWMATGAAGRQQELGQPRIPTLL